MRFLISSSVGDAVAKTKINVSIQDSHIAAFRREFRALVRDLRAVDGKRFIYTLEFREPAAGTMSQFKPIPRSVIAEGLKRAHRDTKPQIYSDRLAGGGPFRQRVDVMADYLASSSGKGVIRTRREGQARFAEADGRIFKSDTGRLGRALSSANRARLMKFLDKLYG